MPNLKTCPSCRHPYRNHRFSGVCKHVDCGCSLGCMDPTQQAQFHQEQSDGFRQWALDAQRELNDLRERLAAKLRSESNPHELVCAKCVTPVAAYTDENNVQSWVHDWDGSHDCEGDPIRMVYGPSLVRKQSFDAPIYYAGKPEQSFSWSQGYQAAIEDVEPYVLELEGLSPLPGKVTA